MKTLSKILSIFAFVFAMTAAFGTAFVDQITAKGWSNVLGSCAEYDTVESDCDIEETTGVACKVKITSTQTAQAKEPNSSCGTILYRDDD